MRQGNLGMCGTKHYFNGNGLYCGDCGHLKDADCHLPQDERLNLFLEDIRNEYIRASNMFGEFHTHHEGYAVIKEELDELWDEVKRKQERRDGDKLHKEAVQVAAMALRFLYDLT